MVLALNSDPQFSQEYQAISGAENNILIKRVNGSSILQADQAGFDTAAVISGDTVAVTIQGLSPDGNEKTITFTASATKTALETATLVRDKLNADTDFTQTYNAYLAKGSVIIEAKGNTSADPTKIAVTEVNLASSETGNPNTRSVNVFKHAELEISVSPSLGALISDGKLGFTDAVPFYIDENGNETSNISDTLFTFSPYNLEQGEIIFDATDGKFSYPNEAMQFSTINFNNGSEPVNLEIDLSENTTQYTTPFIMRSFSQNGFTSGMLNSLNITDTGTIHANYSNGQKVVAGQLALTSFLNNNGLQQIGNASYTETADTGALQIGAAGANGFGKISNSSLESSNVDLTTEMINLIVTQRNIQANSKALETNSQFQKIIMDELT
jgi:flagellar hook protein FlgE